MDYAGSGPGNVVNTYYDALIGLSITVPLRLQIPDGETAGMPSLSAGWSYRHFRFTDPLATLPKAFLRNRPIVND